MGLSALTDGIVTASLLIHFCRVRSQARGSGRKRIVQRLVALTLETVLLTHACAAVMCVLFLASPAHRRTESAAFWVFLGTITELYALSLLFTINSRSSSGINDTPGHPRRQEERPGPSGLTRFDPADTSAWDKAVEGPGRDHLPVMTYDTSSSDPSSGTDDTLEHKQASYRSSSSRTKCNTERMMEEGEGGGTRLDIVEFLQGSNWEDEEDSRRLRMSRKPDV
jgi:hypothetical protein